MKALGIALLLVLCLSQPAWCGDIEGIAAYNRGDYATAFKELKPLAEQGNAAAQYFIGQMYANDYGVSQDYEKALYWHEKAAAQDDIYAQIMLADLYLRTEIQDYKKAAYWQKKLAEQQGFAINQYNLGVMYDKGQGVPQDYQQAAYWYEKAAEQGSADAQLNLGLMYTKGKGVPQDYKKAIHWLQKAAAQGETAAQYGIGLLYANGQGVPQNYAKAHMWLNLAAGQGYESAALNRDIVASKMTPKQVAEAQRLAIEWKPQKER